MTFWESGLRSTRRATAAHLRATSSRIQSIYEKRMSAIVYEKTRSEIGAESSRALCYWKHEAVSWDCRQMNEKVLDRSYINGVPALENM